MLTIKNNERFDLYFDLNLVAYTPSTMHKGSKTSAYILKSVLENLPISKSWIETIEQIQKYLGAGKTIWGVKFEDDKFDIEFYFYYPHLYPQHTYENLKPLFETIFKTTFVSDKLSVNYGCISFNIDNASKVGINIYNADLKQALHLLKSRSYFMHANNADLAEVNTYYSVLKEPGFHQDGFHFGDSFPVLTDCFVNLYPNANPNILDTLKKLPYLTRLDGSNLSPMGVAQKKNAIGIYYMGLTIEQFILFLEHHHYPSSFIQNLRNNALYLDHIKYDIGIDIKLVDNKISFKKTAFFGSI